VALATFLAYMYPAFATLIAVSLGRDRMTRTLGLALLITLTGVSLMLGGPAGISIHGSKWLGVVLIVGNAIAYAIYIVGGEWALRTVHSITATA